MFCFETNLPLHQNWYKSKDFYLNLMVDHGSSGKRTIDNKQRLEKIEQRLDGIDKTLRNLTQMVAALTIKRKHEPMKWRPDQRGNWQENGYNDQCRSQINSEINGRGAIRTNPTANRNFHEPYPLQVYEHRNQGAPTRRDDDNLQRGVFDEQD